MEHDGWTDRWREIDGWSMMDGRTGGGRSIDGA